MDNLFMALLLLSIFALIVGLKNPSLVVRWGTTKTRKQVLLYYGAAIIVFLVLFGVTAPPVAQTPPAQKTVTQTTTQQPKTSFSQLAFTNVSVNNNKVVIDGTTDLPDNSVINIDFNLANRPETATYIGSNADIKVKDSKFSVDLPVPQRKEFERGPYLITALFTPKAQDSKTLELVGNNGEHLSGNLVIKENDFSMMEVKEKKDLQLQIKPPAYVFQTPDQFKQGTTEYALSEYALAWKQKQWDKMVGYTQLTWRNNQTDPASMLSNWYDLKELKGFKIENSSKVSDVVQDINFTITYSMGDINNIKTEQITARITKESAPYNPSPQGQWGVNPVSTLSGQEMQGN